jgi:hypothetical protein
VTWAENRNDNTAIHDFALSIEKRESLARHAGQVVSALHLDNMPVVKVFWRVRASAPGDSDVLDESRYVTRFVSHLSACCAFV